jgi:cation:H+ antiporter
MATPLAILLFLGSAALTLGAAAFFGEKLDHIGPRLGLSEAVVGLLTAAATDAPEVASALVALIRGDRDVGIGVVFGSNIFNLTAMIGVSAILAGAVSLARRALALEFALGLAATFIAGALVLGLISAWVAIVLLAVAVAPYGVLIARTPGHDPLADHAAAHHVEHAALWKSVALIVPAVLLIVAGATGMVRSALVLAPRWGISKPIVGVLILAPVTSLPDAFTAIRLARAGRGAAAVTATLGSNTINIVAGVLLPALVVGLAERSGTVYFDLVWLIVMTCITLVLLGRPGGMRRGGALVLVALYAAFVAVQLGFA